MQNHTIKKIHRRKLFFFLTLLATGVIGILFVKNLLVSFLLSIVGFYILKPVVDFLERRGLSRTLSALVPFVICSLIIWFLIQTFLPLLVTQFDQLKSDYPKYAASFEKLLGEVRVKIAQVTDSSSGEKIVAQIQHYLQATAENIFRDIPDIISSSLTVLLLAPFLTFFILIDGRIWLRHLLSLVPNSFFELALNLNHQISTQMGGFIRARLLESLIIGIVTWMGLVYIQFPYALILAVVAGVLNLIPYIGPFIGAAPAFLIAMANPELQTNYLLLSLVYIVGQVIDTVILVPILVAKIVNLHPVIVVLAVIIGSQTMGILGMIISIPLASVIKVSFESLYTHLTEFRH